MKKFLSILFLSLSLSSTAYAATVVSTIGDKDGFGLGIAPDDRITVSDVIGSIVGGGDGNGTDQVLIGNQSFTFTYSLAGLGNLIDASLEIFHAGDGFLRNTSIAIDGQTVGTLSDAQIGIFSYARLDTFNLSSILHLLNGSETLSFTTASRLDAWALDYAELTVTTEELSQVPVPAAAFLFAPALLGFMGLRRKAKQA